MECWLVWIEINVLILSDLRPFEKTQQSRLFASASLDQPQDHITPGLWGGLECVAVHVYEIAAVSVETAKIATIVLALLGLVLNVDLMIFEELV